MFIKSQQTESCLLLFIAVPAPAIKNAGYSACLQRHGKEINHHRPGSTIICFSHKGVFAVNRPALAYFQFSDMQNKLVALFTTAHRDEALVINKGEG